MSKYYLCDPVINNSCSKFNCQKNCKLTKDKKYAKILIDPMDGMKMAVYKDTEDQSIGIEQI